MPGPSTHILIAEEIAKKLVGMESWPFQIAGLSSNSNSPAEIHRILNENSHYAALGAIGPDLFYFMFDTRKYSKEITEILNFLDEAYAKLDDWFLSKWEKYMGPVSEDFEELISRLTGDLSSLVGDIVGSLGSIFTQLIINYIAYSEDWWKYTSLGHNSGIDNKDFFWADMLHYRKTATYAHVLWKKAEEETDPVWKDRLKAYALGYMTHVGTDTTGHAFVNSKAGGPFRLHWQRHHLVESHVDTRTYFVKHGSDTLYNDFTKSAFHYRFAFKDDGSPARDRPSYDPGDDTLRGRYKRRRQLDLDSDIPEEVINLLLKTFEDVFKTQNQTDPNGNPLTVTDPFNALKDIHGIYRTCPDILSTADGRPEPVDVQTAFHILFRYYKHASLDGFAHEKPSPPEVFPNLDFPSLGDPLHDVAPDEDSDTNWLDIVLSVLALLEWLAEVALWLATVLPGAILDLGTYGPRLLAYYLIELPLYYMVKAFRQVCIEAGYFRPMNDEIDDSMIKIGVEHNDFLSTLLIAMDDILVIDIPYDFESESASNSYEVPDKKFPRSSPYDPKANEFVEYQHPYRYPLSPSENCVTYPGPFVRGTDAEYLVTDAIAANMNIITNLSNCETPNDTVQFCYENVDAANNLGDPVNFCTFLIWQLARTGDEGLEENITEWNMDSDRGYGFKSWDWNRNLNKTDKDYEGHLFCVPCSPLPQKLKSGDGFFGLLGDAPNPDYFNGMLPLKLVYLDGTMQNEIGNCDIDITCYNPNGNIIIL